MIIRPSSARLLLAATLLALSGFASSSVLAETIKTDKPRSTDGFLGQEDQGWFWYKDPPEPPVEQPVDPTDAEAAPDDKKPKPLSGEWIRENLPKFRMKAIDEPTKDNVEMYLLLQKLAMDKAEQFALAHRAFASQNPGIDETIQNPVSGIARKSMTKMQEDTQTDVVKKIASQVGIYYFFRSDCIYCHRQNPMLPILTQSTGLTILPISVDGLPSADGLLPNWRPDQGQAAQLGVTSTPTMYLVKPGDKVIHLTSGSRSIPELRERIVQIAFDNQWIDKNEYDLAMRGMPRRFLSDGLTEESIQDDPKLLLEALREASMHGLPTTSSDDPGLTATTPWTPSTTRGE